MAKVAQAAHTDPQMSNSSSVALAASTNRTNAILINDDADDDVYINLGATAVANKGIRINANGGSYELSAVQGNMYRGVINGITASGTAELLVTEFVGSG